MYSPENDEWAIWWAASSRPGVLDDPVRGRFENGVGTFVGAGEYEGVDFLARFQWLDTDTPNPVWQQDFSFDDGQSWAPGELADAPYPALTVRGERIVPTR